MNVADIEAATASASLDQRAITFAEAAADLLTTLAEVAERQGVPLAVGRLEQARRAMSFLADRERKENAFFDLLRHQMEYHRYENLCEGEPFTFDDAFDQISCALENRAGQTMHDAAAAGLPRLAVRCRDINYHLTSDSYDREAARAVKQQRVAAQ